MTLTDELKILDNKIKTNQAQYILDREAAKISALLSGELEKYEYLTGENSGYKPGVVEKVKSEYSLLGKVLNAKAKSKKDKVLKTDKRDKNLTYNPQHTIAKFKDISDFKEISLDPIHKKLNEFHKSLMGLKKLIQKQRKMKT